MRKITCAVFPTILLLFIAVGCGPNNGVTERSATRTPAGTPVSKRITSLAQPIKPLTIPVGEAVSVQLTAPDTVSIDSVQVFLGGELKQTLRGEPGKGMSGPLDFTVPTGGENTGKSGLRLRVFLHHGKSENQSQQITFLSDLVPREYT